jgi:cytochrome c biogenesis protein CcdA
MQAEMAAGTAFVAGLAASAGPCAAPRYLALTALLTTVQGRGRLSAIVLFAGGMFLAYAGMAFAGSLFWRLPVIAGGANLACATAFAVGGVRASLVRRDAGMSTCLHRQIPRPAFFAGLCSGLTFSPCCGPVALLLGSGALADGSVAVAVSVLGAFVAGHLAPIVATGGISGWIAARLDVRQTGGALTVVNAALMIAAAAYYGLIA